MGLPLAKYNDQEDTTEPSGDQPVSEPRTPEGTDAGRSEEDQQILDMLRSADVNLARLRYSDIARFLTQLSNHNPGLNGNTSTSDAEGVREENTSTSSNIVPQDILDVLPPLPEGMPLLDFFEFFYTRVGGPGQMSVEDFSSLVADTCRIDRGMAYRME
ncbi:hypothetical protein DL769_008517 [Monosporascus sp. CRB-8-3]|nr:hypothetical protein DL769_008517 [Monosporascus sp. CRB-8-3]